MSEQQARPPSDVHNNQDLLIWAMYHLGAGDRWVDVEDVYLKAFELGPARLSWRTKSDIPDYKKCAKALQAVEDPNRFEHLGLLEKKNRYERRLTLAGVAWCEHYAEVLKILYSGGAVPNHPTQDDGRRIRALASTEAFLQWRDSGEMTSNIWELGDAFRCAGDTTPAVWRARLDEHRHAAERNGRNDLVSFIEAARAVIDAKVSGS